MTTKEQFLLLIESAKEYRSLYDIKYPNDVRHINSYEALITLRDYVEKLPENHPVFDHSYNIDESELKDLIIRLSNYGFDREEDPEAFIQFELNLRINKTDQN